ncbi:hypothetical protein [Pinisolibacter sp.]|uniref:hypothetical protein n=1 Tax=Pinisolibacter sp. TaxID=2172024 RepID=UPI002FDEC362
MRIPFRFGALAVVLALIAGPAVAAEKLDRIAITSVAAPFGVKPSARRSRQVPSRRWRWPPPSRRSRSTTRAA